MSEFRSPGADGRTGRARPCVLAVALLGWTLLGVALPEGAGAQRPVPLTRAAADERAPAWSPDGRLLAFERLRDGEWDLWVVGSDGSQRYALTDTPGDERHPAWHPDGDRVAYVRGGEAGTDLWVLDVEADSSWVVVELPGDETHPDWSPDGTHIAFTRTVDGETDLWRVRADGSEPEALVEGARRDAWPRYAPAGSRVAFHSSRATEGGHDEIHLLEMASRTVRRLTDREGHDRFPTWSDDGRRLAATAVESDGTHSLRIWGMDGSATLSFARGFHRAIEADWSPDGRRLAFAGREHDGEAYRIYLVTVVP